MNMTTTDLTAPGRLGDPERSLATDPRADPRLVASLAPFGMDGHGEPPPVDASSPYEELLAFCAEAEPGFQGLFAALYDGLAPVEGVERSEVTVTGRDGNDIRLYVHRPSGTTSGPGILHLHGGGMAILSAVDGPYVRWRDELAARGAIVVGVEFRNAAGALGPHPFPAGLHDCATALEWMHEHRADLGLSSLVVSGESGGGNLTLATTLLAKREGRLDQIDGVYAQCPYISGRYHERPAELASLRENDEYFIGCTLLGALAAAYTSDGGAEDLLAWPHQATVDDLAGLPPHVISVNELDPLRDEGLAHYRKLLAAGVPVVGRTVNGTTHAADVIFRAQLPEVYAASAGDLVGFAAGR
jgi:acetyl esterase/lipase